MCLQNECVTNALAPNTSCVSNSDQLIFNSSFSNFQLPTSSMKCDEYLSYLYSTKLFDNGLGCNSSFVKSRCCNACKSKQK